MQFFLLQGHLLRRHRADVQGVVSHWMIEWLNIVLLRILGKFDLTLELADVALCVRVEEANRRLKRWKSTLLTSSSLEKAEGSILAYVKL